MSRKIGVTEQTYHHWRKEYGGMRVEQARKLKELEKENARLKKLVADTYGIALLAVEVGAGLLVHTREVPVETPVAEAVSAVRQE